MSSSPPGGRLELPDTGASTKCAVQVGEDQQPGGPFDPRPCSSESNCPPNEASPKSSSLVPVIHSFDVCSIGQAGYPATSAAVSPASAGSTAKSPRRRPNASQLAMVSCSHTLPPNPWAGDVSAPSGTTSRSPNTGATPHLVGHHIPSGDGPPPPAPETQGSCRSRRGSAVVISDTRPWRQDFFLQDSLAFADDGYMHCGFGQRQANGQLLTVTPNGRRRTIARAQHPVARF